MSAAFMIIGFLGIAGCGSSGSTAGSHEWAPFSFMTDSDYNVLERFFLILNVFIAFGGLYYAYTLIKEVYSADTGTPRMQEIALAVREGALAYLKRQFTTVAIMIVVLTLVLIFTANASTDAGWNIPIGRGVAFLMGSLFSATVGFVGMYLATDGNLRVAAAAKQSFGKALQIGYRTGTITGMLTDGLGLLGGSLIFLYFGEKAYEALLGFGFGGTLLALFMRVGGGIYTKAADVGADLVGKIEANIPEDDPRNAATIADNVGDNVGDCAGMAADIFESYEVTIVAAMILGYASFGHKGVIFPLLVRAIGVIGSILSTKSVRAGDKGDVKEAMRAVNKGFWLGSIISVAGFMALGLVYLWFTDWYVVNQAVGRGLYRETAFQEALGLEPKNIDALENIITEAKLENTSQSEQKAELAQKEIDQYRDKVVKSWKSLSGDEQTRLAKNESLGLVAIAKKKYVPLWQPLDIRPALTCFVGIILAIALNFCTEYWTGTEYEPVKSLAKSCRTGHATNIIQGIAVGYESTVWAVLIIAVAILSSAIIYAGTNPIFIAFGVAMCGIGMLTLTGNTISMDVFGPVADNANGIGEMGYNKDTNNQDLKPGSDGYMSPDDYKKSRQILADLDAVGNTTKAITKGIAIGSAVIAAVSLFASFIAVMATGSEEGINRLSTAEFVTGAAKLTVADPRVFIGMLIGGAVPFLFSSMTIRAVGRAAYLIVQECRIQFRDKEIWAGTKKPNYGRVVDICTATAQKELIGPALLAIFTPVFVGFFLGPFALGGFLGGMIVVGQLLAAYMANAGGAWDNAKKTIEDQPRTKLTGKGSEAHKASVTGDTVGDPLKDTAGPAINPLIKVMNMVSLLVLPLVINFNIADGKSYRIVGYLVLLVAAGAVGWAWWQSKHETPEMKAMDDEFSRAAEAEISAGV
jgi:K(+)-stimulated pyrophosphate-energized sodium pump